jgi:hypothetical protein
MSDRSDKDSASSIGVENKVTPQQVVPRMHTSSHVTRHTSHATRHTSHVTRHTPHVTRHTPHVTRHMQHSKPNHHPPHKFQVADMHGSNCQDSSYSAVAGPLGVELLVVDLSGLRNFRFDATAVCCRTVYRIVSHVLPPNTFPFSSCCKTHCRSTCLIPPVDVVVVCRSRRAPSFPRRLRHSIGLPALSNPRFAFTRIENVLRGRAHVCRCEMPVDMAANVGRHERKGGCKSADGRSSTAFEYYGFVCNHRHRCVPCPPTCS